VCERERTRGSLDRVLHAAWRAALSGPVVGEQEVLIFASEAELEVPERAAGRVKRPDAHQEQDDVGGNKAGDVLWVLEGLQGKRGNGNQHKMGIYIHTLPIVFACPLISLSVLHHCRYPKFNISIQSGSDIIIII